MVPLIGSGCPWTSALYRLSTGVFLELPLQRGVRALRLGHDHQTGGTDVASRCTMPCRSAAPEVEIRYPAAARPPITVGPLQPGWVRGHTDRLDDHDDVVVVVHDLHGPPRARRRSARRSLRHLHFEPGAAVHRRHFHHCSTVTFPAAASWRPSCGRSRTCGDGVEPALALQAVGHGQVADLGNGAHPSSMPDGSDTAGPSTLSSGAREPASRRPSHVRPEIPYAPPCGPTSSPYRSVRGPCRPGRARGRTAARSGCRRRRSPSRPG